MTRDTTKETSRRFYCKPVIAAAVHIAAIERISPGIIHNAYAWLPALKA
jgi:hypothetical protein